MKKKRLILIAISLVLFFIPFFWLGPGEMDLGGDSSRLYFYDPISYLHSQTLYSITSSGVGGQSVSYYAIPYILFLAAVKSVVISPTILINIFHGLALSIAFVSCYFIIKEILSVSSLHKSQYQELSAILGGLFYVFSPTLILGWDKAIFTQNQIFLNPLIFLLLLKFITKDSFKYLVGAILISFIFAPNFSFVAAPPFFAFYPVAILFLLLYNKIILKKNISIKKVLAGLFLFLLVHLFHLGPHLMSLFVGGSEISTAVFSAEAKFSRGLSYFVAVAQSVKVSISLMNLAQMTPLSFISFGFILFPTIILCAFILNRSKLFLLTAIFFLITLFFVSANITQIGFDFYKNLFNLPGFSMFRNFFGQWIFVFTFFYVLLLAQALVIIFEKCKRKYVVVLSSIIVLILLSNAIPFINGSLLNKIHYQSKNVKVPSDIDPKYEEFLSYVRALPQDGKFISFPLTGPGYQILAGSHGGAYQGPSTISYLAGKNDFTGYDGLIPFNDTFLNLVKNNDYQGLDRLFSLLNIKYIFYNSDPFIYDDTFPKYPYDYVRDIMPKNQSAYKEFLTKLPVHKVKDIGSKYHIFEVTTFLPHIYTTNSVLYAANPLLPFFVLDGEKSLRTVVFPVESILGKEKLPAIFEAKDNNPLLELQNNYHLHVHEPFISRRMDDIIYPFVVWKENNTLQKMRNDTVNFVDFNLLFLSKRIFELEVYEETPITHKEFVQPKLWEFLHWKEYYSWEAGLARYRHSAGNLMLWVKDSSLSQSQKDATKIKINETFSQHEVRLIRNIRDSNYTEKEKAYLLSEVKKIFSNLYTRLDLKKYDATHVTYNIEIPQSLVGNYEVYLRGPKEEKLKPSDYHILLEKSSLSSQSSSPSPLLSMGTIGLTQATKNFTLVYNPQNILTNSSWQGIGEVSESPNETVLSTANTLSTGGGFSKKIPEYKPNTQYLITFDYQTLGEDFIFHVYEKQRENGKLNTVNYFNKNLSSTDWQTSQFIYTSSPNAITAYLQLLSNNEKETSTLKIRNISVIEVPNLQIIFKNDIQPDASRAPLIQFTKINPTKYKIKVKDATRPYTLVFSEAYNKKWQLFLQAKELVNEPSSIKHFDGEILEGKHKNQFIDLDIFSQSQGKVIATASHINANGYANAWTITPEEVNGEKEYELILAFAPQKDFYVYLLISSLTVIFSCVYLLIYSYKKKNEKK